MVLDFMVHFVVVNFCLQQKKILKSDTICQRYAQIKKGPVFLTNSVYPLIFVITACYHEDEYQVLKTASGQCFTISYLLTHIPTTLLLKEYFLQWPA